MKRRPPGLYFTLLYACAGGGAVAAVSGCTAISSSSPLSGDPGRPLGSDVYVFARAPGAPYRTVGFVQIATRGAALRGQEGISDTELDPAVHGLLTSAIRDAGAEGAILVDFEDVSPPLPATRPWAVVKAAPPGRVATRDRLLEVHAELIVFERGPPR